MAKIWLKGAKSKGRLRSLYPLLLTERLKVIMPNASTLNKYTFGDYMAQISVNEVTGFSLSKVRLSLSNR